MGIDSTGMDVGDVIVEEHGGGRLVVEVTSRILQQRRRAEALHRKISEHRDKLNHASMLKEAVHDTVWDYLRQRLGTSLPAVDEDPPSGIPEFIDSFGW